MSTLEIVPALGRIVCGLAVAGVLAAGNAAAQPSDDSQAVYVVVLKKTPGAGTIARDLARQYDALHLYTAVFPGFAAPLPPAALQALQRNPNVELIEPGFTVRAFAESLPSGVDRIDAEIAQANGASGGGALVAVVDTGIDFGHPDLAGRIDPALSRTFVGKGRTTVGGQDDHGHGTHVAGTIAALAGNGIGVVGVAPGATLIALKVLGKNGFGSSTDIIAALDFITAHNNAQTGNYAQMIHVANFSLGGGGSDTDSAYRRAFDATVASGCFIAVAAGNESADAANYVPAAYDAVVTVSAVNPLTDGFASFSNYGPDVDVTAPGVRILSSVLGDGYESWSGTSMATPHVAGAAALYVAKNLATLGAATAPLEIRAALLHSAEPIVMSGDTDGLHEPLVDAEGVVGTITAPDPALTASISTDLPTYTAADTNAVLTVTPYDESGMPVTGLPQTAFQVTGAAVTGFAETASGYDFTVDISGFLLDVDYPVTVEVADSRGLTASAMVTLRRISAVTIHVASIEYSLVFKNLRIYITVRDTAGNGVSDATVSATVTLNGQPYRGYSVVTDGGGIADIRIGGAPNGTYGVTIDSVSKPGTRYDGGLNASDPGFTK